MKAIVKRVLLKSVVYGLITTVMFFMANYYYPLIANTKTEQPDINGLILPTIFGFCISFAFFLVVMSLNEFMNSQE